MRCDASLQGGHGGSGSGTFWWRRSRRRSRTGSRLHGLVSVVVTLADLRAIRSLPLTLANLVTIFLRLALLPCLLALGILALGLLLPVFVIGFVFVLLLLSLAIFVTFVSFAILFALVLFDLENMFRRTARFVLSH